MRLKLVIEFPFNNEFLIKAENAVAFADKPTNYELKDSLKKHLNHFNYIDANNLEIRGFSIITVGSHKIECFSC